MQNKIKCIVFDLDGTLIQSHKTIYGSMMQSLGSFDIPAKITPYKFNKTIGKHFKEIFKMFNVEVNNFEEFISKYKEFYEKNMSMSECYPNVKQVLKRLAIEDYKLALLTTKGQQQAEYVTKHFKIDEHLDSIVGRVDEKPHKPDPFQLNEIITQFNFKPEETIIVGDTELDIQCGKNAGTFTIAVTYGYRDRDKLREENPDFMIDNILEIIPILENKIN